MGTFFASVTALGRIGGEAVDNVLYYEYVQGFVDGATEIALTGLLTNVDRYVGPLLAACMPADYLLTGWRGVPYENDGSLSTVLPQVYPASRAGELTGTRDGKGHCAILRPALGSYHLLLSGAAAIRRSHLAIGPLVSSAVGNNNEFIDYADADMNALGVGVTSIVNDLVGIVLANPIRVSFTRSHVVGQPMTAWRGVTGYSFSPQCGVRKSRNNGR
jgi:hypothetical protein